MTRRGYSADVSELTPCMRDVLLAAADGSRRIAGASGT